MNNNVAAYLIYLVLTIYIIFWVGQMFHRNGRIFILQLLENEVRTTDTINNILLLAYYLFNMGYAFLRLKSWEDIRSPEQLIASLSHYLGILILILAITHYFNMLLIYLFSRRHHHHLTF